MQSQRVNTFRSVNTICVANSLFENAAQSRMHPFVWNFLPQITVPLYNLVHTARYPRLSVSAFAHYLEKRRILLEASTNYSLLCPVSSTPQPQNDFEVWTKVFRCTVYWGCVLLDVTFWWFSSVGCSLNPYKSFLLERKWWKNLKGFNLSRNVHDATKRKVFLFV